MRDALHLTKFANFGRRCPVHAGARSWFSAAARGLPKAVVGGAPTKLLPHTHHHHHHRPQEVRMSAVYLYLHDL
jgi:hypothetical protein